MGKGKRIKAERAKRKAWSVTEASRKAVAWRVEEVKRLEDQKLHLEQERADHMDRLIHAVDLVRRSATRDDQQAFEAAWLSFTRPLIRLAFASGVDTSAIRWHLPGDGSDINPEAIVRVLQDAVEADRQCDLAAFAGPLYVVSPEVHVVIAACAASLSFREVAEAFAIEELPALSGMVVVPDRAPWVSLPHTRAVTWHRLPDVAWDDEHNVPTMRMKGYSHSSIFHRLSVSKHQVGVVKPDAIFFNGRRDLEPCLGDFSSAQGDEFEEFIGRALDLRRNSDELISTSDKLGREAGTPMGEARLDIDVEPIVLGRYLAAFIRLVDQEILASDSLDHERSSSGVAGNDLPESPIRILRLRRAATYRDQPVQPGNWSHRWVVQMHKVRQWYPTLGRHKTLWRGPYIKGPADKPLKPPKETVHAFVR